MSLFFVEQGALISMASMRVPLPILLPFVSRYSSTYWNKAWPHPCLNEDDLMHKRGTPFALGILMISLNVNGLAYYYAFRALPY